MTHCFTIEGGVPLLGEYRVQGNKNAALPVISASVLARRRVRLKRVPRIVDVINLLKLVEELGVGVVWKDSVLEIDSRHVKPSQLSREVVERLRGAILLLSPLAVKFGEATCSPPGGCPIGRRSFDSHWRVFEACGFTVEEDPGRIQIRRRRQVQYPRVYLQEASVTATENALLLMAGLGAGAIENPAREPHVFDLIEFLRKIGCEFELHPLYFRVQRGIDEAQEPVEFEISADFVDAGTLMIAAAVTAGRVTLREVNPDDLMGLQSALLEFGLLSRWQADGVLNTEAPALQNPAQLTAGPWPLFPTDLVSLAIVLATQGSGLCLIHDWMYEARMFFIDKLIRMGASITLCDPHRVLVQGPTVLRGTRLESPDIRAGMALVVAGLCAEGKTTIEHAEVIMRGYEDVPARLRALGARITAE